MHRLICVFAGHTCNFIGIVLDWDLLRLVRNLTLKHVHPGDKPYTETYARENSRWHWDLLIPVKQSYIGTYSCCWKNLHWAYLLMLVKKSYTESDSCLWQTWLTNASERWEILHQMLPLLVSNLNTKTCSWFWQTLRLSLAHGGDEPFTDTYIWWWGTLR